MTAQGWPGEERPAAPDVVEFSLLGPVEARAGGQLIDLGPPRQRCVLAVLLLEANRCVLADQLVERVWGGCQLPGRPRSAVQTYVSLLRRVLGASVPGEGAPGSPGLVIARQPHGYLISVDERLVDVHAFRALVKRARATARDDEAGPLFERALGLWRGYAFGALDTLWLASVRATLDRERQSAERDLTDVQLRQGRHGELLARLSEWSAQHPLDERLAGQLMLALYRSGRQADALAHYQRIRRMLVDELGIEASRALRGLHQQILVADPALSPGAGWAPASGGPMTCTLTRRPRARCSQGRHRPGC